MFTACRPRVGLVVALVLVAARPAAAQSDPLAGFDTLVSQAVRDWKTPGLAIAVVKDGDVVFAKGYGVRRSLAWHFPGHVPDRRARTGGRGDDQRRHLRTRGSVI